MIYFELNSTGTLEEPILVGNNKNIVLSKTLQYNDTIYIKVENSIDLNFINEKRQLLLNNLVILSDENELIFEKITLEKSKDKHIFQWGFLGLEITKPIKNITKLLSLKLDNVNKNGEDFKIRVKNTKEHYFIIENTFNIMYEKQWSFSKKKNNPSVTFKIKDYMEEYSISKIKSEFERFYFELSVENDYLEIESYKIDINRKNQLSESLLLHDYIPFFPLVFNFLDLKIDSNLPLNYKKYLPYFYIKQCNVKITTKYDILFNIIFESSNIKSLNKKTISFECDIVDTHTYHHIENKNKFYNIETNYLLDDIPFESYKRNLFPNFFNNILKHLYKPSLQSNLSSYILMLVFLIIINSVMFEQKDMLPTDPVSTQTYLFDIMKKQHTDIKIESKESWGYAEGYQQYNAFLYAAELALPIKLGQTQSWAPIFDEKRKYTNIYYYLSKIISSLLWFLIAFNIYKLWEKRKND